MTFVLLLAQSVTRRFNCVLVRVRITESESVLIFLYTE